MKTLTHAVTALTAAMLVACGNPGTGGNTATLKGHTTDDVGTQQQGLGSTELGGSGSVSATSKVRVSRLKADGTLEAVGEATVTSGGRYEVSVPSGETKLVAQSVDAAGKVRASVIVEKAEGTTVVSPMTTESSVEAEVLAQMLASGVSLAEANSIDVRARIDAHTAEAVRASTDATVRVKALAEACAAAQRAQLKALAEAGVTVTQSALFDAQLEAAATLNAGLDAAADTAAAEQAYEAFVLSVQAKVKDRAGDQKKAARCERAAGVAFRATLSARLHVNGDATIDAAQRHTARLEARAMTAATEATLTTGAAAQATVDTYHSASVSLLASLRAAASVSQTVTAYAAFQTAVVGSGSVSGSVLGNYLEVNATTQASVQAAITATASASTQLDTALTAAATASLNTTSQVDFDAYALAVVNALKAFDATAQAQAATLTAFGSKADVAVELMAQTNGSLHVMN